MDLLDWGQDEDIQDFDAFEREYHRNFESLLQDPSQQYADPPSNFNFPDFTSFANARRQAESDPMQMDQESLYYGTPQQQMGYQPYNLPYGGRPVRVIKEEPKPNVYNQNIYKEVLPPSKVQKKNPSKQAIEAHLVNPPPPTIKQEPVQPASAPFDILIETQPPGEVRTRTPSEIRTFGITARITGNYRKEGATIMKIALYYANNDAQGSEPVKKDILGGTKTVAILADGVALFDNLTISESSTKHKEREFCLQLTLLRNDGHELMTKLSRPFYAYSHKKVLQRRGSVTLRTLSKNWGKISGGDQMHVIGSPFIQGPALSLIIRTAHGDVCAKPLEYYSDSVLFFELPPYPASGLNITPDMELRAQIIVTNDGRTYSNPLDFTYVSDTSYRATI